MLGFPPQNGHQWRELLLKFDGLEREVTGLRSQLEKLDRKSRENRYRSIRQTRRLNYCLIFLLGGLGLWGVTDLRDIPKKISEEVATRVPTEVASQVTTEVTKQLGINVSQKISNIVVNAQDQADQAASWNRKATADAIGLHKLYDGATTRPLTVPSIHTSQIIVDNKVAPNLICGITVSAPSRGNVYIDSSHVSDDNATGNDKFLPSVAVDIPGYAKKTFSWEGVK